MMISSLQLRYVTRIFKRDVKASGCDVTQGRDVDLKA
jgi:hypothetical protein